jgi:putative phosphoesterase
MLRIGLISDTHSYLDNAVFQHFATVDEIWHAGDFGSPEIVRQLQRFKPLRAVSGNIDGPEIRQLLPEIAHFTVEAITVLMIHIGGYPGRYSAAARKALAAHRPQLFISGHSHILKVMYDDKLRCLHMNPGAAGSQGWHKVRTLIRFVIDGDKMRDCEVIELGGRGS